MASSMKFHEVDWLVVMPSWPFRGLNWAGGMSTAPSRVPSLRSWAIVSGLV